MGAVKRIPSVSLGVFISLCHCVAMMLTICVLATASQVTDTTNIRLVFAAVQETILQRTRVYCEMNVVFVSLVISFASVYYAQSRSLTVGNAQVFSSLFIFSAHSFSNTFINPYHPIILILTCALCVSAHRGLHRPSLIISQFAIG